MGECIIIGRTNVVSKAKEIVEKLKVNIYNIVKPYKHEVMFNLVFLFSNIFATLARKREKRHRLYFDITWVRAVTAITTALNHTLPDFIPLKSPSRLEPDKLESVLSIYEDLRPYIFNSFKHY